MFARVSHGFFGILAFSRWGTSINLAITSIYPRGASRVVKKGENRILYVKKAASMRHFALRGQIGIIWPHRARSLRIGQKKISDTASVRAAPNDYY